MHIHHPMECIGQCTLELLQNGDWLATIPYSIFRGPNVQVYTVYGLLMHPALEILAMGQIVQDGEIVVAMLDVALNRSLRERTRDTSKSHCRKNVCKSVWI